MSDNEDYIKRAFARRRVMCRKELLERGIRPRDIRVARETGAITRIKRGLYRLSSDYSGIESDLADVTAASTFAVICLTSALSYYEMISFIPPEVTVAMPMNMTFLNIEYPPVHIYYFSERSYSVGIVEQKTESGIVRIYSPEKSVCDIFRYRNKLGEDLAVEALKEYLRKKSSDVNKLIEYAKMLRIGTVIRPYITAILG